MLVKSLLVLGLVVGLTGSICGQAVRTPAPGSAERKAIIAALRIPVEKEMKQKVAFKVRTLNISGSWAYIGGEPTTPAGKLLSLKNTVYEGQEDMFDNNFSGLLRKTGGKWRVVQHALGCTDVCYADWWKRFNAPKAIFPYTE